MKRLAGRSWPNEEALGKRIEPSGIPGAGFHAIIRIVPPSKQPVHPEQADQTCLPGRITIGLATI